MRKTRIKAVIALIPLIWLAREVFWLRTAFDKRVDSYSIFDFTFSVEQGYWIVAIEFFIYFSIFLVILYKGDKEI